MAVSQLHDFAAQTTIVEPLRSPYSLPHERVSIVVLGVGRSGTSALARVLNLRGAALPLEILPPGAGNERGHWEPARLALMNHRILETIGCGYEAAVPMPRGWFMTSQAQRYARLTAELLREEYGDAALMVIKEPRLCRLAPLTFAALEMLGISPRIVLPVRHPSEVVHSFCHRDHSCAEVVELRWIRHLLEAEEASRSYARVWVGFDEVLRDWRTVTWRIGARLRVAWPVDAEIAASDIDAFLEPSLRHFDVERNVDDTYVGDLARRLWLAARRGISGDELSLRAEFDTIRTLVDDFDRLTGDATVTAMQRLANRRRHSAA